MVKNQEKGGPDEKGMQEEQAVKVTINREAVEAAKAQGDEEPGEKSFEELPKSELIEKYSRLQEEKAEAFDLYLRSQAEMENVRKRARKEKEDWLKYANESLIKELLPVLDNLEQAIHHTNDQKSIDALREGVELTLKGLKDSLKKSGLEELEAQGEAFDPCYHEAVSEIEDKEVKPGTVLHELQKGYLLNQRLIRPAKVVVSRGGDEDTPKDDKKNEDFCE